jgi:hypothetical protein
MYRALLVLGVLLGAVAGLLALGDIDGLSKRMPTQTVPATVWRPLAIVAVALLVVGLVGTAVG